MTDPDDLNESTELSPEEERWLRSDERAKADYDAGLDRLSQLRRGETAVAEPQFSNRTKTSN